MLKAGFRKCHRRPQHRLPLGCELRALPTHPTFPAFHTSVESMTPPAVQTRFTRVRVRELKNGRNSVTVQNRSHVYMNFFHHKGLGNHLLQLCPKVVKHSVYYWPLVFIYYVHKQCEPCTVFPFIHLPKYLAVKHNLHQQFCIFFLCLALTR